MDGSLTHSVKYKYWKLDFIDRFTKQRKIQSYLDFIFQYGTNHFARNKTKIAQTLFNITQNKMSKTQKL